ncbi:MAG: hypothetical protein P8L44_15255, partial [Opitutales bacterium]|nr:hypothetical protein [Opitutales bacterium]
MRKTITMLGLILLTGVLSAQWQAIDTMESYTVGDEVDADHTTATTGDWNMYRSADDQYATLPFFGIAADPGDG